MTAKYYIYWNLHRNVYSVRFRGRVIDHYKEIFVYKPEFKVSQAGRQRVLKEKQKNVHAYVVCTMFAPGNEFCRTSILDNHEKVSYNPYKAASFVDQRGESVESASFAVLTTGENGKPEIFIEGKK